MIEKIIFLNEKIKIDLEKQIRKKQRQINKHSHKMSLDSSIPIDDYYISRITLSRIETVYHNGFMSFFELISKSPDFFNNAISADDLFNEFISDPINEIKEKEKDKKNINRLNNLKEKKFKMDKHQIPDDTKCLALIHIKRQFRQCQNDQLSDDDFCVHHSKLDVLPYGRVNFYDDDEDE
jgi:hypothetical protein